MPNTGGPKRVTRKRQSNRRPAPENVQKLGAGALDGVYKLVDRLAEVENEVSDLALERDRALALKDELERVAARRQVTLVTPIQAVEVEGYVWCDHHGEVHDRKRDAYEEEAEECNPENWRTLYMQEDDQ
jgi:hypothetical protein